MAADGVENEVAEGMKIELEHDSGAVTLHRSCADQQFRTYFSIRLANSEKRDDLSLARRERAEVFQFVLDWLRAGTVVPLPTLDASCARKASKAKTPTSAEGWRVIE